MTYDFAHLESLHVTDKSEIEHKFEHPITGALIGSIWFRPMANENKAYVAERVRIAVERAQQAAEKSRAQRKSEALSADTLDEDRDLDRMLLARTCATRWGTPPKLIDGTEPEFSETAVHDFLKQCPTYMVDECRNRVGNIYNFIARPPVSEAEAETLGNS